MLCNGWWVVGDVGCKVLVLGVWCWVLRVGWFDVRYWC